MLLAGKTNPWKFMGLPTAASPTRSLSNLVHLVPGRSPGANSTIYDKLLIVLAVVGFPEIFQGVAPPASSISYL